MIKRLKTKLINHLVKNLLPIIRPEDVIIFRKDGKVVLGGDQISNSEMRAMKEEIKFIKETKTWKFITDYLQNQAKLKMFEESKDFTDLLIGKMMIYNINAQKEILERIVNYKIV